MSIEDEFHVYITGEVLEGYELATAQESFAEKFKLTTEKVQKVFQSPMPFYIKKSIGSKTANAYKKAIHAMGLDAYIEPVTPPKAELSLVPQDEVDDTSDHLEAAPQIAASKSYASVVERKEPSVTSSQSLGILYETPSAELSEDDDKNIGGWLRFFQVANILSIVIFGLLILAVFALGLLEGFGDQETIDTLAGLAEVIPPVVFSFLILRILGDSNEETPFRINMYLKYSISATAVVFMAAMGLFFMDVTTERPESLLGSLVFYYIWTSYFKKSVRVKEYYGCNAA